MSTIPETSTRTEFSEDQYLRCYPDGIENNWWHLARNGILENAILTAGVCPPKVLDIGCGRGITVAYLQARGIDCQGVEIANTKAISPAEAHIRVATDFAALPQEQRDRYNIVLLLDVIEHLPDPVAFLRAVESAFPHLSTLIITVPGGPELWSNYDVFYGHHRRYTTELLEEHARDLQWNLTAKGYFFHSVYLAAWMIRKSKQDRETTVKAPSGPLARLAHRFIAWGLRLEYKMIPKNLRGLSALGCFTVNVAGKS